MENLLDVTISVEGKGSDNLDYGAVISLWNGPDFGSGISHLLICYDSSRRFARH